MLSSVILQNKLMFSTKVVGFNASMQPVTVLPFYSSIKAPVMGNLFLNRYNLFSVRVRQVRNQNWNKEVSERTKKGIVDEESEKVSKINYSNSEWFEF